MHVALKLHGTNNLAFQSLAPSSPLRAHHHVPTMLKFMDTIYPKHNIKRRSWPLCYRGEQTETKKNTSRFQPVNRCCPLLTTDSWAFRQLTPNEIKPCFLIEEAIDRKQALRH